MSVQQRAREMSVQQKSSQISVQQRASEMSLPKIFDVQRVLSDCKDKKPDAAQNYEKLRSQLEKPQDLSEETLAKYLRGFRLSVADLTAEPHEILVGVVIKIDWTTRGEKIANQYFAFVTHLISTQTVYLHACLEAAVDKLSLYAKSKDKSKRLPKDAVVENHANARAIHRTTFTFIHHLIQAIVRNVPLSPNMLYTHAKNYFPFIQRDGYIIECYVYNLLQMSTYLPSTHLPTIRADILLLIFENLVKLDLAAPHDDVKREETTCVELMMDEDIINVATVTDIASVPTSAMLHKGAKKMDNIMCMVFAYIQGVCHDQNSGKLNWEVTRGFYRDLLVVFDKIILPTNASNYIQYVMFYICSFRPSLADDFLCHLWTKAADRNESKILRQNAVTYISDYLSHAKYVSVAVVRAYLKIMCDWAHAYIAQTAHTLTKPDLIHHEAFYAVCQGIYNVVVARHRELLDSIEDVKFCNGLDLRTIVYCRLNPLNICAPIVADMFAVVARRNQLVYCDAIIQQNRRRTLPEVGQNENVTSSHLKNVTPFNEYILTLSGRLIAGLYRESDYKDLGAYGDGEVDMVYEETEFFGEDEETGNHSACLLGPGNNSFGAERSYLELHVQGRSP